VLSHLKVEHKGQAEGGPTMRQHAVVGADVISDDKRRYFHPAMVERLMKNLGGALQLDFRHHAAPFCAQRCIADEKLLKDQSLCSHGADVKRQLSFRVDDN
jgi:hypothetical protein